MKLVLMCLVMVRAMAHCFFSMSSSSLGPNNNEIFIPIIFTCVVVAMWVKHCDMKDKSVSLQKLSFRLRWILCDVIRLCLSSFHRIQIFIFVFMSAPWIPLMNSPSFSLSHSLSSLCLIPVLSIFILSFSSSFLLSALHRWNGWSASTRKQQQKNRWRANTKIIVILISSLLHLKRCVFPSLPCFVPFYLEE